MDNQNINYPAWMGNLRRSARMISTIFLVFYALIMIATGIMAAGPRSADDYLFLVSSGIYVIGLLIGFKWEGLGGLIALAYLCCRLIDVIISNMKSGSSGSYEAVNIGILVFMIPCVLHILSWFFHRKIKLQQKAENFPG